MRAFLPVLLVVAGISIFCGSYSQAYTDPTESEMDSVLNCAQKIIDNRNITKTSADYVAQDIVDTCKSQIGDFIVACKNAGDSFNTCTLAVSGGVKTLVEMKLNNTAKAALPEIKKPDESSDTKGYIILFGLAVLYLLPTIIAVNGKKKNAAAIFILNLCLGWSGIFWILALVWAFIKD